MEKSICDGEGSKLSRIVAEKTTDIASLKKRLVEEIADLQASAKEAKITVASKLEQNRLTFTKQVEPVQSQEHFYT
jgi:septum formation inhibitor MinC